MEGLKNKGTGRGRQNCVQKNQRNQRREEKQQALGGDAGQGGIVFV